MDLKKQIERHKPREINQQKGCYAMLVDPLNSEMFPHRQGVRGLRGFEWPNKGLERKHA